MASMVLQGEKAQLDTWPLASTTPASLSESPLSSNRWALPSCEQEEEGSQTETRACECAGVQSYARALSRRHKSICCCGLDGRLPRGMASPTS